MHAWHTAMNLICISNNTDIFEFSVGKEYDIYARVTTDEIKLTADDGQVHQFMVKNTSDGFIIPYFGTSIVMKNTKHISKKQLFTLKMTGRLPS